MSSDTLPLSDVDDQTDSILAQKLSQVSGVGLVTLNGAQKPAIRVQVDPQALAGSQLSLEDIRAALVADNVNQAKGTSTARARTTRSRRTTSSSRPTRSSRS